MVGSRFPHDATHDTEKLRHLSSRAVSFRRTRRSMFPEAALRGSCWDILLLCFDANMTGRTICVKQIRSELDESSTSVLRRLQELEDAGLVLRQRDAVDGRRTIVLLTREANEAMARFLMQVGTDHC